MLGEETDGVYIVKRVMEIKVIQKVVKYWHSKNVFSSSQELKKVSD